LKILPQEKIGKPLTELEYAIAELIFDGLSVQAEKEKAQAAIRK
jgi:hypothetical protein